ncbi:MAG: hypothetical protein RIT81_17765 [Deltaproteobacteria bacterium]
MIRYEFTQPSDELRDGEAPKTASLWLDAREPDQLVDVFYEGDAELIERIRGHLLDSYGTRGAMNDVKTRPNDLIHAVDVSRQLDDYEPRRSVDTVKWPKPDEG